MKKVSFLIIYIIFISCSSQRITMYHYDNSRYDGYEIMCNGMKAFFNKDDPAIHISKISSVILKNEMKQISEKLKFSKDDMKNCDGYLYYAFISKKDTLYSDYNLDYWRNKNNGSAYKLNEKVKEEINEALKNVKVSQNNQ